MSEELKNEVVENIETPAEVTEPVVEEVTENTTVQQEPTQIEVDAQTAYNMKLLEFDNKIAEAKATAAKLEHEKMNFIYQSNVQEITRRYQESIIRRQVEEGLKNNQKTD